LSINPDEVHSNFQDLIELKIPALSGKAADNNKQVLEILALNGPLLKYGILKHLEVRYSTISRRVDDLTKRGYLTEAGTRTTKRGRQSEENMYGLTWKGLIASLAIQNIRKNILQVFRKNPQLNIPERELVLEVIDEIYTQEDMEDWSCSFLTGFLNCTAPPLDDILDEDLKSWLLPALRAAPQDQWKRSDTMNLFTLLDNPKILQYVKEKYIPLIAEYERQLFEAYQLIKIINKIGIFLSNLDTKDKPSEKLIEYIEKIPDLNVESKDNEEGDIP